MQATLLYLSRSVRFSSGVRSLCSGTRTCFVMLMSSSAALNCTHTRGEVTAPIDPGHMPSAAALHPLLATWHERCRVPAADSRAEEGASNGKRPAIPPDRNQ